MVPTEWIGSHCWLMPTTLILSLEALQDARGSTSELAIATTILTKRESIGFSAILIVFKPTIDTGTNIGWEGHGMRSREACAPTIAIGKAWNNERVCFFRIFFYFESVVSRMKHLLTKSAR